MEGGGSCSMLAGTVPFRRPGPTYASEGSHWACTDQRGACSQARRFLDDRLQPAFASLLSSKNLVSSFWTVEIPPEVFAEPSVLSNRSSIDPQKLCIITTAVHACKHGTLSANACKLPTTRIQTNLSHTPKLMRGPKWPQ